MILFNLTILWFQPSHQLWDRMEKGVKTVVSPVLLRIFITDWIPELLELFSCETQSLFLSPLTHWNSSFSPYHHSFSLPHLFLFVLFYSCALPLLSAFILLVLLYYVLFFFLRIYLTHLFLPNARSESALLFRVCGVFVNWWMCPFSQREPSLHKMSIHLKL